MQISEALEQINHKQAGKGPLAEIDFWRDRATAVGFLHECLCEPQVNRLTTLFSNSENSMKMLIRDVTRQYDEARDTTRFLMTVERHIKNLTYGTNFRVVMDTIYPLVNSLRMVWIVSRHYNTDERVCRFKYFFVDLKIYSIFNARSCHRSWTFMG